MLVSWEVSRPLSLLCPLFAALLQWAGLHRETAHLCKIRGAWGGCWIMGCVCLCQCTVQQQCNCVHKPDLDACWGLLWGATVGCVFTFGLGQLFGKVCSRFYGPDCHLFPVILSVFVSYHWNMLLSDCWGSGFNIECLEDSMGLVSLENIGNICNFIMTVLPLYYSCSNVANWMLLWYDVLFKGFWQP